MSYYGGEGATGSDPASRTYYAYNSNQTAASNTYNKTGYNFANWNTASGGGGTTYAAGATNVAMNAREVCLNAQWTPKTYTVRFENLGADAGHKGSLDTVVTYNDTINMKSGIVVPSKTHYDFGGYYISTDGGVTLTSTQIINANGAWVKNVSGYTGEKGNIASWICDGDTTLYAKWTEHAYTITTAVSPAGAGSISVGESTTAKYVTASGDITATANAGWVFKEWQFSETDEDYDVYVSDGSTYQSTDATIRILAEHDGTLTAVFEPRYYLVGGEITGPSDGGSGTSSGMPGWDNYTDPFNVITSSPVLATCSLTLGINKNFYIMVRDKANGLSYGKSSETLEDNETLTFTDKDNKVLFYSNGGTDYTFKITAVNGDGRPSVSVERPYQVNIGRKRVDIDGNDHDDNTGGTVDLSKQTAPETWTPISNGDWVPYGISVKYNASKEDGYTLDWYTASDYATQFSIEPYWFHTATSTGNGYAKFTEISTSVTLANDGHGKVQIGGVDATNTTCGVTTTRELTAVPNEGYKFFSWTTTSSSSSSSSSPDFEVDDDDAATVTLTGHGAGTAGTLTANFTERWQLKAESEGWGSATFTISNISTVGGDAVGYVDISLSANTNYQFTIVDLQESATYKNGSDRVYYMTNGNSHVWGFGTDKSYNCGITTAGAGTYRFTWNITDKKMSVTYPNFIIYRTGDNGGVNESYDGGTINQAIEFRMKVHAVDTWYSLCLPFEVSAVKVWDDEDGRYYDLVPFYRTGGTYYTGHYIIRTPESTTDFALANFGNWNDPTSPTDYVPSKNTPYIIQWHDNYFLNKYISFFGATGQTIPTSMSAGSAPSSDNVVNVCHNNSMTSGSLAGAYMLEGDYGGGAWLRLDDASASRAIPPFECYLLANSATRALYKAIQRGMVPTAIEAVCTQPSEVRKVMINGQLYIIRGEQIYTIQGTLVK